MAHVEAQSSREALMVCSFCTDLLPNYRSLRDYKPFRFTDSSVVRPDSGIRHAGFISVQHFDWCNLFSAQDAAALCKNLPYEVTGLRIRSLRFRLPDLSRWKLELVMDGCALQVRQKAMPSQVRANTQNAALMGLIVAPFRIAQRVALQKQAHSAGDGYTIC